MMLGFLALTAVFISGTAASATWGYGKTIPKEVYGPPDWGKVSKFCLGSAQSPVDINIDTKRSVVGQKRDDDDMALKIEFSVGDTTGTFSNNGHAPTFTVTSGGASLKNPINGQHYILAQFHFHFGCTDDVGSEHTVNGKPFPGEVHYVFYNSKYGSLSNAAYKPDGLTVVGVFLSKYSDSNFFLRKLAESTKLIQNEGSEAEKQVTYLPAIIPVSKGYYSYKGSLTTPGCFESVSWIVLESKLPIDETALQQFRMLKATHGKHHGKMCDNYRPTQPLNGRKITFYENDD